VVVGAEALREAMVEADWLVNTTSVGMLGGPPGSPAPAGVVPARGAVVDLVYRPRPTPLLTAAARRASRRRTACPMLVHQGAAAFEAWTGRRPPLDVMRAAVERALAT
jgi:shikimate dehydrogenase